MAALLPFMTAYDPPGSSEGTLDPLGFYQIADQLAVQLVPSVRERMQRIRFLAAMAVGSMVTAEMDDNPEYPDSSPYLVWEWLVVESIIRTMGDDPTNWSLPGTLVTRRALETHGYLDARSYLKTPRIFGFNGVYKRLALHLGIVDVHLGPGPNAEALVDAWARGSGYRGLGDARPQIYKWADTIRRCLREKPPRTRTGWSNPTWSELAQAFAPGAAKAVEKRCLRELLLNKEDRRLGALPTIWELQGELKDDQFSEEKLHNLLEKREPAYGQLLLAIRSYEAFARRLQDGFDILKAEAARPDAQGFNVPDIASDKEFTQCVNGLHIQYEATHRALSEITVTALALPALFEERFQPFSEPLDAGMCALALCEHHEKVQRGKSLEGKRAWFDRIGGNRVYIRHAYRKARQPVQPGRYVHTYRGWPIRNFWRDLI